MTDGGPQFSRRQERRLSRQGRAVQHRRRSTAVIVVLVSVALVLAGLSFGYVWLTRAGCEGPRQAATIVASPDQYAVLGDLARRWERSEPTHQGRCVGVDVQRKDSSEVAAAIGPDWDARRDGPRPDVWAPDSTAWMLVAAGRPEAASLLPANPPSLATSAVVLAMPRPMATAMGWPDRSFGWLQLIGAFIGGKTWARFGHPEWGKLRLDMTDPTRSTTGLSALLTITDANGDEKIAEAELRGGLGFSRSVTTYVPDTDQIFAELDAADAKNEALASVNAFPALERDVAAYNAARPNTQLAAVYPQEGTVYANYPYAVLDAPWVDGTKRAIAGQFLQYLRGPEARASYAEAGYRDASRSSADARGLTEERGFYPSSSPVRELVDAASVTRTIVQWTALRRSSVVLAVLDSSGTMADPVPGTGKSRMQIMQAAAIRATSLWNEESRVGLWEFADELTPTTPYRELVPTAPVTGTYKGVNQRIALNTAILGLRPKGNTALYDTVWAAFQEAQRNWQPNRLNLVSILTDGKDDNESTLTLDGLIAQLQKAQRPDRPVQVMTLAYTSDADVAGLKRIADSTGGTAFSSPDPADMERVFIESLFGSR